MANKQNSDRPYKSERDTEPHQQTGNINFRNNNTEASTPSVNEPNIGGLDNEGIGDSGLNNEKLTNHTSNHSQDA